MSGSFAALIFALAVASISGSACAMKPSSAVAPCRVSGADKLPAAAGGADSLCAAIDRAVSSASPGAKYSVEVRILSPYSLAATILTADGHALPQQTMTMSDRKLTTASIERFAGSIGAEVAKAGNQ